jgi:O-antigen ligase
VSESRRYKWHLAFIFFCMLSLIYTPSVAYGVRMIAKLMGPFLFMIAFLSCIKTREELQKALNAILGSGAILVGLALFARAAGMDFDPNGAQTGIAGLGPPSMGPPVFAAHMLPVAMLALSTYLCRPRASMLIFTIVCAGAVLGALQRTSAGALYLGFSAILLLGTRGIWRLLLPAAGVVGLPALMVLSDTFRRRMFYGNSGSQELLDDPAKALTKVNSSGRSELWDTMLGKFFSPHPTIGSGIGSTQDFLYSRAGVGVVHSEYVRLLCEVGVIGLVLFATAALSYMWMLRKDTSFSNDSLLRIPALAGIGGMVSYLVYCSTDNAFDYVSQFGIYVFSLVAIAQRARQLGTPAAEDLGELPVKRAYPFPNLIR